MSTVQFWVWQSENGKWNYRSKLIPYTSYSVLGFNQSSRAVAIRSAKRDLRQQNHTGELIDVPDHCFDGRTEAEKEAIQQHCEATESTRRQVA